MKDEAEAERDLDLAATEGHALANELRAEGLTADADEVRGYG